MSEFKAWRYGSIQNGTLVRSPDLNIVEATISEIESAGFRETEWSEKVVLKKGDLMHAMNRERQGEKGNPNHLFIEICSPRDAVRIADDNKTRLASGLKPQLFYIK